MVKKQNYVDFKLKSVLIVFVLEYPLQTDSVVRLRISQTKTYGTVMTGCCVIPTRFNLLLSINE